MRSEVEDKGLRLALLQIIQIAETFKICLMGVDKHDESDKKNAL